MALLSGMVSALSPSFRSRVRSAVLSAFVGVVGVLPLAAANVTLDVDVHVGSSAEAASGDEAGSEKPRQIAVFILDRSQSMVKYKFQDTGVSRDKELKKRLEERVKSLGKGTEVVYFAFGSTVKPFLEPQVITDDSSRDALFRKMSELPLEVFTLLYDAQAQALDYVRKELEKNPRTRVDVYLYSDGDHQTDLCASSFPAEFYVNVTQSNGKKVHKRDIWGDLAENGNYSKDKESQFRKFDAQYSELRKDPRLTIVQEYLGDGNCPDSDGWMTKPTYAIRSSFPVTSFDQVSDQKVKGTFQLPLSEKNWKALDGKKGRLRLTCNGQRVDRPIEFKKGAQSIQFSLPDFDQKGNVVAKLEFEQLPELDKDAGFALQAPKPVTLTFRPLNKLDLSVVQPGRRKVVRVGDEVVFEAKASSGASVQWKIGGVAGEGDRWTWKATKEGEFPYSATATKDKSIPAEVKGEIGVIRTGVTLSGPTKADTGVPQVFTAKGIGPVSRYAWTVDGVAIPCVDKTLTHVFKEAGTFKVQVKANYGSVPDAVSEDLAVAVRKAPFVEISTPVDGSQFTNEDEISAEAKVEGTFNKIEWTFKGQDSSIVFTNDVGKAGKTKIAKDGGAYEVTARVFGGSDKPLVSDPVKIRVRLTNLKVEIKEPMGRLETGRPFTCKAEVGNENIVKLEWSLRCNGKSYPLGVGGVDGKIGTLADVKLPTEIGDARAFLTAKAVFAPGKKMPPVVSEPVELGVSTPGEVRIVSQELTGATKTSFVSGEMVHLSGVGQQVKLVAQVSGVLGADGLVWYVDDGSGAKAVQKGGVTLLVKVPDIKVLAKKDELPMDYWVEGLMPDGKTKKVSQKVSVSFFCCPGLKGELVAKDKDGNVKNSFKPNDTVNFEFVVMPKGGTIGDVTWTFGDGATEKGKTAATHVYKKDAAYTVTAEGHCPTCGKLVKDAFRLSTACPDLELSFTPKDKNGEPLTKFGLKDEVRVSIQNSDATDITWNFGDGTVAKGDVAAHTYKKLGTYTISLTAKCRHCGKSFTAKEPREIEVTVVPPKAQFDIQEKGSYYTVGSKLHLTNKTGGDYTDLIWTTNGAEVAEFRGKQEAVVKLPSTPGEMIVGLRAIAPEGLESSDYAREVRIRYGWWAIIILALLALIVLGLLYWLLTDNGPAGWLIKFEVGPRPNISNDRSMKSFAGKFKSGYREGVVGHFWSLRNKAALMPIKKLAKYTKVSALKSFPCAATAAIKVGLMNGKPYIKGSNLTRDSIGGMEVVQGDKRLEMFQQSIETEGKEPKYLFVALDTNHPTHVYVAWLVILSLGVVAAVAWATFKLAI